MAATEEERKDINLEPYYWDQARIMVNGVQIGRAENIRVSKDANWEATTAFGYSYPLSIRNRMVRVTGTIGMCYLDNELLKLMADQTSPAPTRPYVDIVIDIAPKMPGQQPRQIRIRGAVLNWEINPWAVEEYARASVDFMAKDIEGIP